MCHTRINRGSLLGASKTTLLVDMQSLLRLRFLRAALLMPLFNITEEARREKEGTCGALMSAKSLVPFRTAGPTVQASKDRRVFQPDGSVHSTTRQR
jgi:hypothetical protein